MRGTRTGLTAGAAVGVVAMAVGFMLDPQRGWANALMAGYAMLQFSLAGLFFLAVHQVTGATWHTTIRRVPEAMAAAMPVGAIVILAVLLMRPSLYPWYTDPFPDTARWAFKSLWLSRPFFLARSVGYLACWVLCARTLVGALREDEGPASADRRLRLAITTIITLGLTLVPAAFDWIMSLNHEWFSTMIGFYEFAGIFLGGLAMLALLLVATERMTPGFTVTVDQRHDMAKFLFAFATFWAYLWFSQYMLIWYANITEETGYFIERTHGHWAVLFWGNVVLNWGLPFLLLLSVQARRSVTGLVAGAISILCGRLVDLHLSIALPFTDGHVGSALAGVGVVVGAFSLFALATFAALAGAPLVPRTTRADRQAHT
ncbi:MAG: hypothetical protein ABL971_02755 [Vicinamibacterales bacterium]